jgi:urea transporter
MLWRAGIRRSAVPWSKNIGARTCGIFARFSKRSRRSIRTGSQGYNGAATSAMLV